MIIIPKIQNDRQNHDDECCHKNPICCIQPSNHSRIGSAETSATTSKAVNASVFRYILFQNRLFAHWFEIKASAEQVAHHTRQITSMITKDGLAFAKNAAIGTLFRSGIFQSIAAVTPKSRYRTPDLIKLSWNCFGTHMRYYDASDCTEARKGRGSHQKCKQPFKHLCCSKHSKTPFFLFSCKASPFCRGSLARFV